MTGLRVLKNKPREVVAKNECYKASRIREGGRNELFNKY